MSRKVIVLELNELSPELLDRFIAQGELPNFKRLRDQSIVAVTDAEEAPPNLEPWIQWVTVHTGLTYGEHKVFDLDDGHKLTAPRIWDVVSDAGEPVWVCGSMNAALKGGKVNGWFVPDPWSSGVKPYPEKALSPFFRFVQTYVQEHSRTDVPLSKLDHARFAAFMIANGLSAKTVQDTILQLTSQLGRKNRWRRAAILDRLQWDLFRAQYRRLQPTFATFFANSTAHYQHYHWREWEPEHFAVQSAPEDVEAYADAIPFGYRKMDELVGECLQLAGPDTTVVLCTALSQEPCVKYEGEGGKKQFRCRDVDQLTQLAGVTDAYHYAPVMAEEFHLRFADEAAAERACERLAALRTDEGQPLMRARREGEGLLLGCAVTQPPPGEALIRSSLHNQTASFHELFYPIEGLKSGWHHPDGVLWIRTPSKRHAEIARKVSLTELAPTFLALCGLPPSKVFAKPALPEVSEAVGASALAEVA